MDYSNLNDIEFEYLCKDIVSRMLSVNLERYCSGKDGGIDLADDAHRKNIIVQVKHYQKSPVSQLILSLKKEVPKVKELSPQQYYVCCSKELTPKNKEDIYNLFSDYMASTANIITTIEIDDFLSNPDNSDILRKHFKLWLNSTNILSDILSNDIFIDSEMLLCGISEETSLFVRTEAFTKALHCLEKKNVLIIVGNPGVGKTVTSKMLVLHYAANGYRVRYTTDGANLNELKKALSQSPKSKEIVLLDDCFGQAYFNMKETQENELLSLIKYIHICPNKVLILNSRVTIFQEAKERNPDLIKSFDRKEFKAFVLNVDDLSLTEKAKIFYNHLYFCEVPPSYYQNIKDNQNYREIVKHPNYNPRIIEFVCSPNQIKNIDSQEYASFIIKSLNNPEQIWKNEYEHRLAKSDRILLTTIYSLTDTTVSTKMVRQCFEHRISAISGFDSSINHFSQSLARLSDSIIKIMDVNGIQMLSAANPSVNDFLRNYISDNGLEYDAILHSCISVRQFKRLLSKTAFEKEIGNAFANHAILDFVFESDTQKANFIACYCAINQICDVRYKSYVIDYLHNIQDVDMYENGKTSSQVIVPKMLCSEFAIGYGLEKEINDKFSFSQIVDNLSLPEQVSIIKEIDWMFKGDTRNRFLDMARQSLQQGLDMYCTDVPAEDFDIDINELIDNYRYEDEFGGYIDADEAVDALTQIVEGMVSDEITNILSLLPEDIGPQVELSHLHISVNGASSIVESYLRDDYDIEYDDYYEAVGGVDQELDYIFNR